MSDHPPNWPIQSFDAQDWAREFCRIAKEKGHDLDEGWMISWFACALMRGWDEHRWRQEREAIARAPETNGPSTSAQETA